MKGILKHDDGAGFSFSTVRFASMGFDVFFLPFAFSKHRLGWIHATGLEFANTDS